MPVETLELVVFDQVVRHSSFARAADELALTPSGVSKIVSRLESRLGARLLQRTTRRLTLSEAGVLFHARAVRILAELKEAEADVATAAARPRGTLKISAPVAFGRLYLAPLLERWLREFPDLSIDLTLTDQFVDLIEHGIDLALRIGALPDSNLVGRRLCTNRRILVASPQYLGRRGHPKSVADLKNHECLLFTALNKMKEWRLVGPNGLERTVANGRLCSNNAEVLIQAARDGHGIARGATFVVAPALLAGDLVRVLAPYEFEPTAVYAVYPSGRQLSKKVRAVTEALARALPDPPVWDRSLSDRAADS
jgi:DNA-binding transcriptional LysR family regulator